jgi:hypothetical protein
MKISSQTKEAIFTVLGLSVVLVAFIQDFNVVKQEAGKCDGMPTYCERQNAEYSDHLRERIRKYIVTGMF